MTCDFCGDVIARKDDVTVIPVSEFSIPSLGYVNLSWGWGGCLICGSMMELGEWDALLDRAVAHASNGERIRPVLAVVYAGLRDHQTGPMRGWLVEVDG